MATTFDLDAGQTAQRYGKALAASKRKETLEACRTYLIDLAMQRDNMCVTADDAAQYVEQNNLESLGNAAGSLFDQKHWEFTGEWEPSHRTTNHGHKNRVWRLRSDDVQPLCVGQLPVVEVRKAKPLTPSQAQKELRAIDDLYENDVDITPEVRARLRQAILDRLIQD